jgi:hypothetical protein
MVTWGGGILRNDIVTKPDTPSTQRALTPDNVDATSAIRKGQVSNSGELEELLRCTYNS